MVCEPMAEDLDFKNLRRLVAVAEGSTLYSKLVNLRKDQRAAQTILKGKRQIVMLSRFGQESMKIELESGRRAKNAKKEERLKRFMELMNTEVKPEDLKCESKLFFKTYASFHLVTARDGVKATCSCPTYYQDMVCEHVALMDMLYDGLFHIQVKFVDECAEFRKRVGRRKGGQKEDEETTTKKKSGKS